ncbi:MAG: PEP-CTERM sorting domain-containing protein [Sedimentisphaerales bacterium]|nr:PEP-CTERM sorting domain-containing protein [Sedimentisphaerales bacterium]
MMKKLAVLIAIFFSMALSPNQAHAAVVDITDGQYYQDYTVASGTLNVLGGSVENLTVRSQATVNIQAGQVNTLWAYPESVINILGGSVGEIVISADSQQKNAVVNLFGNSLQYEQLGPGPVSIQIQGEYANGHTINIRWLDEADPASQYSHMFPAPEPATILILSLGTIMLRKKRRTRP